MKQTIYTCDRCKAVVPTDENLCRVKVVFTNPRQYSYGNGLDEMGSRIPEADWCEKCINETGFATFNVKANTPQVTPPSLEDMIREIAASAAQEAVAP